MTASPTAQIREHLELVHADLAIIARLGKQGRTILDIGAGPGSFVREAGRAGHQAYALDLEPSAAAFWRKAAVQGVVGDGFHLPFKDASFDLVRLKEVIEHVQDPRALLLSARRVLKDRGFIIAHVPSPYSQFYPVANFWDDYTHVRPLTRRGLERLFGDADFEVLNIEGYVFGRNAVEKALGYVVKRVLPHTYRVTASRR